jgi:3-oxoacyl-(acyl-carrier-protein) synthase
VDEVFKAWKQVLENLSPQEQTRVKQTKMGVILASTKGFVDDLIWKSNQVGLNRDLLSPILSDFLEKAEIQAERTICVSNACTSSLSALFLAEQWLQRRIVTEVLVIATDFIGPFVVQGFHALRALTNEQAMPFAKSRSGLRLGEAAAAILLTSREQDYESHGIGFDLVGVGLSAEGFAATRPSQSGGGLKKACLSIQTLQEIPPDLVIAHGTATLLNDSTEDQVFSELFHQSESPPLITATKGSIGHTLGASGSMDVIAACEVLKNQEVFLITNSAVPDPTFQGRYLCSQHAFPIPSQFNRVLVTSVGFGGVNAAALIQLGGVHH